MGSGDTVGALFRGGWGKPHDHESWTPPGAFSSVSRFDRVDAVNRGGIDFRQHRCGRVEENRCAEKRQISLESEIPPMLGMWSNTQGPRRTIFDTTAEKKP